MTPARPSSAVKDARSHQRIPPRRHPRRRSFLEHGTTRPLQRRSPHLLAPAIAGWRWSTRSGRKRLGVTRQLPRLLRAPLAAGGRRGLVLSHLSLHVFRPFPATSAGPRRALWASPADCGSNASSAGMGIFPTKHLASRCSVRRSIYATAPYTEIT